MNLEGYNYIQSAIELIYGSQQIPQNEPMGDFDPHHEAKRKNQVGKSAKRNTTPHEEKKIEQGKMYKHMQERYVFGVFKG